jgi:hypothetical protein
MRPEEAAGNSTLSQPRCEIEKFCLEGECQRPGEVRYKGILLLCGPHAALLELEDRAQAVLGSVFRMDEWLQQNGSSGRTRNTLGAYGMSERRPQPPFGTSVSRSEAPARRRCSRKAAANPDPANFLELR